MDRTEVVFILAVDSDHQGCMHWHHERGSSGRRQLAAGGAVHLFWRPLPSAHVLFGDSDGWLLVWVWVKQDPSHDQLLLKSTTGRWMSNGQRACERASMRPAAVASLGT